MSQTLKLPTFQTSEQRREFTPAVDIETVSARRMPFFVPRDQAYFWSLAWQSGETEALREIAEGTVRRFESGSAAAEWLLSDED